MIKFLSFLFIFSSMKSFAGFSFEYSNDFFTGTDRYYSQGIELSYKNEKLKKFLPKTPLFIKPRKVLKTNYSFGLDYLGFTPKDAYPVSIQLGDRPFANILLLKGKTDSFLKKHQIRLSSIIKVGAIGKVTGGEFVHKSIHKATGNRLPRGWDNQIENDLLLSYEAVLRKYFNLYKDFVELQGQANIEFGSFRVVQTLGAKFKFGKIKNFSELAINKKKKIYYFFLNSSISQVYFDASMQGGLLNRDSAYKLSSKEVENYVGKFFIGVHLGLENFSIKYQQAYLTKEFSRGESHSYGKLSLLFDY